jgi:hypothetical protein
LLSWLSFSAKVTVSLTARSHSSYAGRATQQKEDEHRLQPRHISEGRASREIDNVRYMPEPTAVG